MQNITSLANTYTYLGENLIEEVLAKEPDEADLVRAASALRGVRRALGSFIVSPISEEFSGAEIAAENCEILKDHLEDLMGLSSTGLNSRNYAHLLQLYAIDIYTLAARIAFLLSKQKASVFK